jgi:hypothetical protein
VIVVLGVTVQVKVGVVVSVLVGVLVIVGVLLETDKVRKDKGRLYPV